MKKLTKWQAMDAAPGAIEAREALKRLLQSSMSQGRDELTKSISADLDRLEKHISWNGLERYASRP